VRTFPLSKSYQILTSLPIKAPKYPKNTTTTNLPLSKTHLNVPFCAIIQAFHVIIQALRMIIHA